jgi:thiol-disulfide isomerase/thioredoxin
MHCSRKSKVNFQEDFFEYHYRTSHLPIDSSETNDNSLIIPKYLKDLDFLNGYKIPIFSAEAMDGEIQDITYKGKFTILNFWFISCPPCVTEIPFLNLLQIKYSDNLQIISLCRDAKPDIIEFMMRNPINYTVIPEASDLIDNGFRMKWGYPKNILVGSDGKVLTMTRGFHSTEDENYKNIEDLLKIHINK